MAKPTFCRLLPVLSGSVCSLRSKSAVPAGPILVTRNCRGGQKIFLPSFVASPWTQPGSHAGLSLTLDPVRFQSRTVRPWIESDPRPGPISQLDPIRHGTRFCFQVGAGGFWRFRSPSGEGKAGCVQAPDREAEEPGSQGGLPPPAAGSSGRAAGAPGARQAKRNYVSVPVEILQSRDWE